MKVLSVDPGREKCGIAVVEFLAGDGAGKVLYRAIEPTSSMPQCLRPIVNDYAAQQIVIGDSTHSAVLLSAMAALFPHLPITAVSETNSTLEARELFWQQHPPSGWRRWLPRSLQTPPTSIDDFAAVVIARRFLEKKAPSN